MVIVANVLSLVQYVTSLKNDPEKYCLQCCPHPDCGKLGLWRHGYRYRKTDRENPDETSLNPIPILRFYCPTCKRTTSLLPECIPPLRWYLWLIQQLAIKLSCSGLSFNKISQQISPSRFTISRWIKRLTSQFEMHALYFKAKWAWLGYHTLFDKFWSALLEKIDLSHAMLFLNAQGVLIP